MDIRLHLSLVRLSTEARVRLPRPVSIIGHEELGKRFTKNLEHLNISHSVDKRDTVAHVRLRTGLPGAPSPTGIISSAYIRDTGFCERTDNLWNVIMRFEQSKRPSPRDMTGAQPLADAVGPWVERTQWSPPKRGAERLAAALF